MSGTGHRPGCKLRADEETVSPHATEEAYNDMSNSAWQTELSQELRSCSVTDEVCEDFRDKKNIVL